MNHALTAALVTPFYPPLVGGAENANQRLSAALAAQKIRLHVITPRFRPEWPSSEQAEGVTISRYPSFFPPRIPFLTDLAHSAYPFAFVSSLLDRLNPDLLHLHYFYYPGYAAWRWAKRRKKPIILTLAGDDVFDPFHSPCSFLIRAHRRMVHDASRVVVPAAFLRASLQKNFSADADKIRVIPWGVDTNRFHPVKDAKPIRLEYNIPKRAPVVVAVQRLHPRKGIRILLEAIDLLVRQGSPAYFLIAGEGPERPALERFIRERNLASRVRLLGRIPDDKLPGLYQAADLFAMHSYHEGFGLVFLEAMASGLAVVTTRAGGGEELIVPNETGLLVQPGDVPSFASALKRLLEQHEFRRILGGNARKKTESLYSWPAVANAYRSVYEETLKKDHRP